jgi:hypothetical protein
MTPEVWIRNALVPALRLLPPWMDTAPARAMVLAICLQESGLEHRRQVGGPARGYAQFEQAGVHGVMTHDATWKLVENVLVALDYPVDYDEAQCHAAIEHNDILAAAFARLLLWTLPDKLPAQTAPSTAWSQYAAACPAARPRRESWDEYFSEGWDLAAVA